MSAANSQQARITCPPRRLDPKGGLGPGRFINEDSGDEEQEPDVQPAEEAIRSERGSERQEEGDARTDLPPAQGKERDQQGVNA
ncbi:MAG: hypothetical protein NVS4B10_14010 [Myxococcales bacterium]